MSRELKFRLWDGNNNHFDYPEILEINIGIEYQQFTGLLDKQGKEIYESDIVEERVDGMGTGRALLVTWDGEDLTYKVGISMLGGMDVEIIGNIDENPELLK